MPTADEFLDIKPKSSAKTVSADDFLAVPEEKQSPKDPIREWLDSAVGTYFKFSNSVAVDAVKGKVDTVAGLGKAAVRGLGDLAGMAHEGYSGVAGMFGSEGFEGGAAQARKQNERIGQILSNLTKINLADSGTKEDEAAAELLNILPAGAKALGEEGYLRSGQALDAMNVKGKVREVVPAILGAGGEAAATLLMLKPDVVRKGLKTDAAKVQFDEVAAKNPETAEAIATHVEKADPELGKELKERAAKPRGRINEKGEFVENPAPKNEKPIDVEELLKGLDEEQKAPPASERGDEPVSLDEFRGKKEREEKGIFTAGDIRKDPEAWVEKAAEAKFGKGYKEVDGDTASYQDLLHWAQESKKYGSFYMENYGPAPDYPGYGVTKEKSTAHEASLREWAKRGEAFAEERVRRREIRSKERSPLSDDELLALYNNKYSRRAIDSFNEPQGDGKGYGMPRRPEPTGDKMADRAAQVQFMRDLRKWSGEDFKPLSDQAALDTLLRDHTPMQAAWNALHSELANVWEGAKIIARDGKDVDNARAVSGKSLLKAMVARAENPVLKSLLETVSRHMPETKVKFYNTKGMVTMGFENPNSFGVYNPNNRTIYLRVPFEGDRLGRATRTALHEMVHAATYDFIAHNPTHPLTKEINSLRNTALMRLLELENEAHARGENLGGHIRVNDAGTDFEGRNSMYGITNAAEMMAEAYANPVFQQLLVRSEKFANTWGQLKETFNKIADVVKRMLNIKDPGEAKLLHSIMDVTERIMVENARYNDNVQRALKGEPLREQGPIDKAFELSKEQIKKLPGGKALEDKLALYFAQTARTFNPELLGPEAKSSAAIVARRIAEQVQKDTAYFERSRERQDFWNKNASKAQEFIAYFERGAKFKDPIFQKIAQGYRDWNQEVFQQDSANGIRYEPQDNYLFHTFENGPAVADFFAQRFGPKWSNPGFIKERSFEMYEEAKKAGFKPRFTNPEDIMLARQHASDVQQMRVQVLEDLRRWGLARKGKSSEMPKDFEAVWRRSPNGDGYWVDKTAAVVLHNAFDTKSLWTMQGMGGDLFRGAMALKNAIVPIRLALSLFHPLHVLTIHNATAMVRASKGLLSGVQSAGSFMKDMAKAAVYSDLISSPKGGYRLLQAYRGKIREGQLTEADVQSLRFMAEGGMIPEMSAQFRSNAREAFKKALAQKELKAIPLSFFAALDALQYPMFQVWIPSLKINSYLKDVQTALKTRPELLTNEKARVETFRALSKSVDNRYGEMPYNTLFMNRMVKDLLVANTLSLGWQMGFLREYGGGMMDLGKATRPGSVSGKVARGELDRPLFVMYYTAQALAYGGLLTYLLSGKPPQGIQDYVYPKVAEGDEDKKEQRVTTMFYPREIASIYHHMEKEGVFAGLGHLASSKASGVIGLVSDFFTGKNSMGQEIADPNAPSFQQLMQKLKYALSDLEPISVEAIKESDRTMKSTALNVAGFSRAPGYATESKLEASIKDLYRRYYQGQETPFERAQMSQDTRELRRLNERNDEEGYQDKLDEIQSKYDLTAKEMRNLEKKVQLGSQDDSLLMMFSRLPWQRQKRLLDEMTEEERDKFLPHANKDHLRFSYEPPEGR